MDHDTIEFATRTVFSAYCGYLAFMMGSVHAAHAFSKPIRSQEELEDAVRVELPKYQHLKPNAIIKPIFDNPRLYDSEAGGICWKLSDDEYELTAYCTGTVRHELAHIFKGHLNKGNLPERKGWRKPLGYFQYYAYYEPVANLHGVGIRV